MGIIDTLRGWFKKPGKRDNYAATYGSGNSAGFAGGAVGRLAASMSTWAGSVNLDLDASLVIMRARARQLAQSNEYGRRFLSLVASNIVGHSGPKLQVRAYKDLRDPAKSPTLDKSANDVIEIHWMRFGKKADITGRGPLSHLLRIVAKSVARDGEALVRIIRDSKLPYGIALQLLEADRLAENINLNLASGAVRQGVEIDASGRAVAYWIHTQHPGDRYGSPEQKIERIPAGDIIHVYLPERAEQVRGYTWFHAILMRAHQLHGFNESAVIAARIGASKIMTLERSEEAPDATAGMGDAQIGGAIQMNVEAGEIMELPPGYKSGNWNPEYPHANFESFVKAAMRGISAGLDVATHNLSGDMTDVNYSSARIAELAEREQWMVLQDWFIAVLIEPIYEKWLEIAMLRGDITFDISGKALPFDKRPKFAAASRFQGRRWSWVDPSKEVDASQKQVDLGINSRTNIAAAQGREFDDILDELKAEQNAMDAAGIRPKAPAAAAPQQPGTPGDPQ
ncbi:MAG: phage portal protein [Gallionellales bacterium RBG_16_57_15]|nr:MAG: phage portal protein [Gallionellales bacterium RBG_16_57_15]